VGRVGVEGRVGGGGKGGGERRLAGGRRSNRLGRADVSAAARSAIHDEGLPEPLREPLRDQSAVHIVGGARGESDNDPHRPRRIGLRPSYPRHGRQRGSGCCQMQKISAGKFHFEPPSRFTSFDHLAGAAGYGVYVFAPAGRRTVNTEPLPGLLVTVTSPPIMRASLRERARPSPVPPKRWAVEASAWLNSSNSLACCSGVMPMPVSETANSTKLPPLLTVRAASLTSPALVNLQALLRRLSRICRSRMASTVNAPRFSWASTTRRFLFCSASCPAGPMTSLISGASCTGCGVGSSFPASIFDRSSTWLMRPRR